MSKSKPQCFTKNEEISDLLTLANAELEEKSKIIKTLTLKIDLLECGNLETLEESALEQLRDFYGSKLSSILAALTNLEIKNSN